MTSFNLGPNGDQVLQHFGTQAGCVEDQPKKGHWWRISERVLAAFLADADRAAALLRFALR
jgi:hypothetical protein